RIVVATGAYEVPLTFANNDLVGVMLSSAVRRLIHLHGIVPGKRAAVVGPEEMAADLRRAGLDVAALVAPESVVGALGGRRVTGARARDGRIAWALMVVWGRAVPVAGLLAQGGGANEAVTAVGRAAGETLFEPPPEFNADKRTFVCFCADVTS